MKALIIGATGATGKPLIQHLLKDDRFSEVHVFTRREMPIEHPKLKVHLVDFDRPHDWSDLVKGDVAFSCLGTTLKTAGSREAQRKIDVGYQYHFAETVSRNGVNHFILLSAYGANPQSKVFYSKMKGELEEMVRKLPFESLTFFRPGVLDRPNSDRFGENWSVKLMYALNAIGILKKYKPLPVDILAKAMIKAAESSEEGFRIIALDKISAL